MITTTVKEVQCAETLLSNYRSFLEKAYRKNDKEKIAYYKEQVEWAKERVSHFNLLLDIGHNQVTRS